ncbi:MAG TPA: hypothetical protein DDZ22_06905 [Massilia sp.]|nr:hypothetical protein [Massilia sp.]
MIAKRLGRTNLGDVIPDFVALAESRLYTGSRDFDGAVPPLRLTSMLATESQSLAALPAGFLSMDRLTVNDGAGPRTLEYVTPQRFASLAPTGFARYYTFQDGGIAVEGGQPANFTMSYYRRFPALTGDADTNWLLENCPAAYLYAALIEAYAHLKDDARIPLAARMYASAVNGLIDADNEMKFSGSTLVIGSAR